MFFFCFYLNYALFLQLLLMSIEEILKAERAKYSLPIEELSTFLYTPTLYTQMKALFSAGPTNKYNPNIFNKSRLQYCKNAYEHIPMLHDFYQQNPQFDSFSLHVKHFFNLSYNPHQTPGTIQYLMFIKYIELLGTEEQKKLYLKKSRELKIVGCYAQTQLGHGSDVSSLQTTATFDPSTQQWILNTPSISAAKFWPGDMGIVANYAIIFAQAIVRQKSKGVYAFIIQIKDDDYNWMPGIQGGDVGPKIGFATNENGYMLMHNVRIPKNNLFNKYVEVSKDGEFKKVGDPRVGFGAMMYAREMISCVCQKLYSLPIIIAVRYALFRKQFKSGLSDIAIIDYQTQQQKLLPRIAEYYAMCAGSTRIRLCSEDNLSKVYKGDFSLLQQTHSNLALGKCLYTQIVSEGTQILRRSLGGHGTSYYSGIPQLLTEGLANIPAEGENTVMYLQTARYVMKSYMDLLKGKKLMDSVKYLTEFDTIEDFKLIGRNQLRIVQLRKILLRGIDYVLNLVMSRIQNKAETESMMEIINYKMGNRLQQLAQLHAVFFTVNAFVEDIDNFATTNTKSILTDLCKIFSISQIQRLSQPILQANFICRDTFNCLQTEKEAAFTRLRPIIVGLVDSFAVPQKLLRSQFVRGQPYNNLLDRSRECELNSGIQESQLICKNIANVLAKQLPKL